MNFVSVEANLLYILEDELRPEFQSRFCKFNKTGNPLFIIIQLKDSSLSSLPMIHDLKSIRIDKAIKKINNWIKIYFAEHNNLTVKVIDGTPQVSNPYLDFSGINKLNVYRSSVEVDQIVPMIREYFDPKCINLKVFGK